MNDSLDLRKRIIKMRESNNLVVTSSNHLDKNLSSKSVNNITEKNSETLVFDRTNVNDKTKEIKTTNTKNNKLSTNPHKEKFEDNNIKSFATNNEAQFLMLANKFNEAVEVILELSEKVDRLEKKSRENSYKTKTNDKSYSFLNFKLLMFLLIITLIVLVFLTFPFDFSLINLIVKDIFSKI